MYRITFTVLVALLNFSHSGSLLADVKSPEESLRLYVRALKDSLATESLGTMGNRQAVKGFLKKSYDIKGVGKAIMDSGWENLSDEQKDQFIEVFADRMVEGLLNQVADYRIDPIALESVKEKKTEALV